MLSQEVSAYQQFVLVYFVVLTAAINSFEPIWGIRDSNFVKRSIDASQTRHLSSPAECARVCKKGEPPKTCYYRFTTEIYVTMGDACRVCTPNANNTGECQCVQGDGYEKTLLTINRMLPGPSIQICDGDKVIIDVINRIEGMEVSLHWHGILQRETQYYDGVPMVTQCAIPQGDTFRYLWYGNPGTHFYHAHTGLQKLDGLYGSIVVRQAQPEDPNGHLYGYDLPAHVVLMSDYMYESAMEHFPGTLNREPEQLPDNVLINGKGQFTDSTSGQTSKTPLESFAVNTGNKYRFRLINSFASVCPAQFTIQGHSLTVIATDGASIIPVVVDSIVSFTGERYDFVLDANQTDGAFWIQTKALGACASMRIQQLAVLRYATGPSEPSLTAPTYYNDLPQGVTLNPLDAVCNKSRSNDICINQLKNAEALDETLLQEEADIKIFLPFKFYDSPPEVMFKPHTYDPFIVTAGREFVSLIDEISFLPPPSPPLSQPDEIPPEMFCNGNNRPTNCSSPCFCTHKIDIPLDAVVEVLLVDEVQIPNLSHPFHLHGHKFRVFGVGRSPDTNMKINLTYVMDLDRRGLLERHFESPPGKDTLAVPNNGYILFRFRANNPGYWFFHCHIMFHIAVGMDLIMHVGTQADLPPVPNNFPRCGNFLSPIGGNETIYD